jgi:hypothetical protein
MSRPLALFVALSALCLLPDRVSADHLKPHEGPISELSSRQRCVCTWHGPTRIGHRWRYRIAYLRIGYDPLPYRFGSTFVWQRPYRYYWR